VGVGGLSHKRQERGRQYRPRKKEIVGAGFRGSMREKFFFKKKKKWVAVGGLLGSE